MEAVPAFDKDSSITSIFNGEGLPTIVAFQGFNTRIVDEHFASFGVTELERLNQGGLTYGFQSFLKTLSEYNVILVKDNYQIWYQFHLREYIQSIQQLLAEFKSKLVFTMGVSGGGFAAILFGHYLKATLSIAYSPRIVAFNSAMSKYRYALDAKFQLSNRHTCDLLLLQRLTGGFRNKVVMQYCRDCKADRTEISWLNKDDKNLEVVELDCKSHNPFTAIGKAVLFKDILDRIKYAEKETATSIPKLTTIAALKKAVRSGYNFKFTAHVSDKLVLNLKPSYGEFWDGRVDAKQLTVTPKKQNYFIYNPRFVCAKVAQFIQANDIKQLVIVGANDSAAAALLWAEFLRRELKDKVAIFVYSFSPQVELYPYNPNLASTGKYSAFYESLSTDPGMEKCTKNYGNVAKFLRASPLKGRVFYLENNTDEATEAKKIDAKNMRLTAIPHLSLTGSISAFVKKMDENGTLDTDPLLASGAREMRVPRLEHLIGAAFFELTNQADVESYCNLKDKFI
ncbi:MAG TPA: hypothetical protein DD666_09540 [Advenella kashmirensis]|uniref:Uncharacterized protein n=1 Tax=Advenella kashmirensis TaxID=310575 RepID=A0A356LFE1_9BURK|nr:hypothetical protein [Advenella kashmirensis]